MTRTGSNPRLSRTRDGRGHLAKYHYPNVKGRTVVTVRHERAVEIFLSVGLFAAEWKVVGTLSRLTFVVRRLGLRAVHCESVGTRGV